MEEGVVDNGGRLAGRKGGGQKKIGLRFLLLGRCCVTRQLAGQARRAGSEPGGGGRRGGETAAWHDGKVTAAAWLGEEGRGGGSEAAETLE